MNHTQLSDFATRLCGSLEQPESRESGVVLLRDRITHRQWRRAVCGARGDHRDGQGVHVGLSRHGRGDGPRESGGDPRGVSLDVDGNEQRPWRHRQVCSYSRP